MKDIRIFICRAPKSGLPEELTKYLFGIQVRVRGYLLVATTEPTHLWEVTSDYLIHNDDLRNALVDRYGPAVAETLYQFLPVGQVTKVAIECCEVIPHPTSSEED